MMTKVTKNPEKNKIHDKSLPLDILIYLVMGIVLVVCVLPFMYIIAMSLSSSSAILNNRVTLWPIGINGDAYKQIFSYPNFFRAYKNTITYTFLHPDFFITDDNVCLPLEQTPS